MIYIILICLIAEEKNFPDKKIPRVICITGDLPVVCPVMIVRGCGRADLITAAEDQSNRGAEEKEVF